MPLAERRPATSRCPFPLMAMAIVLGIALLTSPLASYPLDGYRHTGIRRLRAYELIQEGSLAGTFTLPPGALYPSGAIVLRLADAHPSFDITSGTPTDPALQAGLDRVVGSVHPSYRAAIADITDPAHPRYAAVHGNEGYIPGSVGKLLVMTGLFDQLRRLFPTDVEARIRVLRDTKVVFRHGIGWDALELVESIRGVVGIR